MMSATSVDFPTLRHWPPTASRKPGNGGGMRLAVIILILILSIWFCRLPFRGSFRRSSIRLGVCLLRGRLCFYFADALGQLRQTREPGVLCLELLERARWSAPDSLTAADCLAGGDAGFRAGNGALFGVAVI